MKVLRTTVGGTIAGLFVGGVWGAFAGEYGILGGWAAAFVIISLMWFMNHYCGLIYNVAGASFVDMATAIATACIVRDLVRFGVGELPASLTTFFLVALGGAIGGALASAIQKSMDAETEKSSVEEA